MNDQKKLQVKRKTKKLVPFDFIDENDRRYNLSAIHYEDGKAVVTNDNYMLVCQSDEPNLEGKTIHKNGSEIPNFANWKKVVPDIYCMLRADDFNREDISIISSACKRKRNNITRMLYVSITDQIKIPMLTIKMMNKFFQSHPNAELYRSENIAQPWMVKDDTTDDIFIFLPLISESGSVYVYDKKNKVCICKMD